MKKCDLKGSIDSIETLGLVDGPGIRTVVFLNGCKLRCLYCHNPEMWKIKDYNMTVDELVNKILRYKPYYKDNGGVTFSGGEPLLQSDYLLEVCKHLKKEKINIALDTAGVGNYNEKLLDYIDLIIFDIKAVKSDDYNYITGYKGLKAAHKYFAFGSLICMIMAVYSGHKMISGNKRTRKQVESTKAEE